jgi:nicotinamidase/pyrazinamidase
METKPPLLFWDVDTQADFLLEGGKLYVPGAEALIPRLERLTAVARRHGIPVVASADDHRPGDAELSDAPDFATTYPPHCLHGTPGQAKIPATRVAGAVEIDPEPLAAEELERRIDEAGGTLLLTKTRFDVFSNPNTERVVAVLAPKHVVVYGVALDVCVDQALEGLWERGFRSLTLVTDATLPIDRERGEAVLARWRSRGVEMRTTEEILDRLAVAV